MATAMCPILPCACVCACACAVGSVSCACGWYGNRRAPGGRQQNEAYILGNWTDVGGIIIAAKAVQKSKELLQHPGQSLSCFFILHLLIGNTFLYHHHTNERRTHANSCNVLNTHSGAPWLKVHVLLATGTHTIHCAACCRMKHPSANACGQLCPCAVGKDN
jgi:hypothetical protein